MSEHPVSSEQARQRPPAAQTLPDPAPGTPTAAVSEDLEIPAPTPTLELGEVTDRAPDGVVPDEPGSPEGADAPDPTGARADAQTDVPADATADSRARHRASPQADSAQDADATAVHRRSLFARPQADEQHPDAADRAATDASDTPGTSGTSEAAGTAAPDAPGRRTGRAADDGPLTPTWHARTVSPEAGTAPTPPRWVNSTPQETTASNLPPVAPGDAATTSASTGSCTDTNTDTDTASAPVLPGPVLPPPIGAPRASRTTPSPAAPSAPVSDDDVLLAGSVVVGHPASRAAAHWLGALLCLVLLPTAWFLLHAGASVLTDGLDPYDLPTSGRGLALTGAGALVGAVALWTARHSSLGCLVVGVPMLLAGVAGVAGGPWVSPSLAPFLERLADHSTLGELLARSAWSDLSSGRLAVIGAGLVMVGIVSHGARRAGRREQMIVNRGQRETH